VNKVMLIGHVGNDPEVRTTGSGTRVANFSLATNEVWYDKSNEKQERTDWHRCTAWDKVAEVIEEYVSKGDRLYVEGRISYSQTEDKGVTKYWTDIVVREIVMLGSPGGADSSRSGGERSRGSTRTTGGTRRPARTTTTTCRSRSVWAAARGGD
jgi:single-strand DNA-binding protein